MSIPADATYLEALRHAHESVLEVVAYEDGVEVGPLNVVSMNMTVDGTANIQRSADIQVAVDPLTTESRDTLEAITTNAGEVVVKHGVGFGGALVAPMVQIARLRVDEITWSLSGATRTLRCFDRSLLLQDYILPTARPLNDTYTNLIATLIDETLPGEGLEIGWGVDTTKQPAEGKSFNRGEDRLAKIQELAQAVDGWLVCNPDGSFRLEPGPASDWRKWFQYLPSWHFNQGSYGVLVNQEGTYSRREQYNAVGVEFTPADDTEWSAFIFLWDNDPTSPTWFDGGFGKKPILLNDQYDHLPTVKEAEAVARRHLYEHSGKTRAIRVTAIYNPTLLPGDYVTLDVPDGAGGYTTETHQIERLSFDFGSKASMDVELRLYREPGSYGVNINGPLSGWSNINISGDATGAVS